MTKRHFTKGSAVFSCQVCGRRTRITTQSNDNICQECYDLAGLENELSDNGKTDLDEANRLLADAVHKGGDEARIRADFPTLFKVKP